MSELNKSKKIKILYCEGNTDGTVGGSYYLLFDLVISLDKEKFEPVVVFYNDNVLVQRLRDAGIETLIFDKAKSINFRKNIKNKSLFYKIITLPLIPIQKIINFLKVFILPGRRYAKFLTENQFDLVNLNNSLMQNHDWMYGAKLAKVKCITHEMGINKFFSTTAQYFGKDLNAIICLSYAISNNMKDKGLLYDHITTIHCGIDTERLKVRISSQEIRKKFNIDANRPVIGVVGNIKEWKGQETVVNSISFIKEKYPNICCIFVGDVPEEKIYFKEHLLNICKENNIEDNIIFAGFQEFPLDFMSMMDIVIHSSIEPEPFGIVNLEAMFVKKPIISTNIGGPVEIFEDGKSAILVTPGEPKELASAVIRILSDKKMATNMGEEAFNRLMNKFTLKKSVEKTEHLYLNLFQNND